MCISSLLGINPHFVPCLDLIYPLSAFRMHNCSDRYKNQPVIYHFRFLNIVSFWKTWQTVLLEKKKNLEFSPDVKCHLACRPTEEWIC